MSHRHLLTLLGLLLVVFGILQGGWWFLLVWLGCDFLILAIAHFRNAPQIFGKRADGTLPFWSWTVFLPLLLYTMAVWHLLRLFSREPSLNKIDDELFVGRRLLPGEIEGEFANYIDLTAEFPEPRAMRRLKGYQCFPILDGSAPDAETLLQFIKRMRPGRTFIHCAQGHGRTGTFALALMLKSGVVRTVEEGLERLKRVRPGINLSAIQHQRIKDFISELK